MQAQIVVENTVRQRLLRSIKGSVALTCAAFVADNALATVGMISADPAPDDHLSGKDVAADIEYARLVCDQYIRYGPISGHVAEVGPGGSAAVALLLLTQGCESIDLVDRFAFSHAGKFLARTYEEIVERNGILRDKFKSLHDLSPLINSYVGEKAAAEIYFKDSRRYDAIVSCAVLEHLYDPIAAVETMADALSPGGRLVHNIDFRDHGMFTSGGHHELTFLTIPQWLYPSMSRRRGRPNRVLAHEYRAVLERIRLDYKIFVTHLVGVGPVEPAPYEELPADLRRAAEHEAQLILGRLARPFQNLSIGDLATSGIIVSASKPS